MNLEVKIFLEKGIQLGGFNNEDIVAIFIPLLKQFAIHHDKGLVGENNFPFLIIIKNNALHLPNFAFTSSKINTHFLEELQTKKTTEFKHLNNYKSYELNALHHDATTDIYLLGLLMASFAMNLDLSKEKDFTTFKYYQNKINSYNKNIHPNIATLISDMTELDRQNRIKNIYEIIGKLENYNTPNFEFQQDLSHKVNNKKEDLLLQLKSRLFDLTKRNKMLYFKNSNQTIDLTVASFPKALNIDYIQAENLFTWNTFLQKAVANNKTLSLKKIVHFNIHTYLSDLLNTIRLKANRNINEYGFSELKLVGAFLHWYDYNEDEAITSPLFFIPVKLIKRKGIENDYLLEFSNSEAEINPILQFQLKELYQLNLPDSIDFSKAKIEDLYHNIKEQIEKQQNNVHLKLTKKIPVKKIHNKAFKTLKKHHEKLVAYTTRNLNFNSTEKTLKELYPLNNYSDTIHKIKQQLDCFDLKIPLQQAYSIENNDNKYVWEIDLCQVTLGNFNYKKMTLVKDYNEFIQQKINAPLFETLFKEAPEKLEQNNKLKYDLSNLYNIVKSDPSQDLAIIKARNNESYLIQGPPGTGKSQTITNLIADFTARGKKVLFVSEKRAALDVVYHRLKQENISEICSLIHDSQSDKKAFIQDLKNNYERNLQQNIDLKLIEKERENLINNIQDEIKFLSSFHLHMTNKGVDCDNSVSFLLNEMIKLKDCLPENINNENFISLPSYKNWENFGNKITHLYTLLEQQGFKEAFAQHPINIYKEVVFKKPLSINELQDILNEILNIINTCKTQIEQLKLPNTIQKNLSSIFEANQDLQSLLYFGEMDFMELLNPKSASFKSLLLEQKTLHLAKKEHHKAIQKNKNWKEKLSVQECENALEIIKDKEGKLFSIFNKNFRKIKKVLKQAYNFKAHQISPSYTQILLHLKEEYTIKENLENLGHQQSKTYAKDIDELIKNCEKWHIEQNNTILYWFNNYINNQGDISKIKIFITTLSTLNEKIKILNWEKNNNLIDLENKVCLLLKNLQEYAFLTPIIKELFLPENELVDILKNKNWKAKEINAATAFKSLQSYLLQHKNLSHFTSDTIHFHTQKLQLYLENFRKCNALYIKAKQQYKFNQIIRKSNLSVANLNETEKLQKSNYLEGRKILENEFNKTKRFKSIRNLATAASNTIIKGLKPVWLMSPLSVSDTLPIKENFFDVVIFDEASQITLENSIPALYRANQTIIVGDKMQMPPSNFFNKKQEENNTNPLLKEEVNSLLDQGINNLPSLMLQRHYRSKHESLISYSNAAFYQNKLQTIPDVLDLKQEFLPIEIRHKTDAAFKYKDVYNRPISYHYIKKGIYHKRSNTAEAEYIAELVKHLLLSQSSLSVGIVAFSKEQQKEIEEALDKMSFFEKGYEALLNDKLKRHPNYPDIFIKNLESVQGDERDIIIMSTCYAYNKNQKMLMNFGPINRKGGEKRLNVIFSRAKKHMVVVSSIKHTDITNENNEGANYFKNYLNYTEQMSIGNTKTAQQILQNLHWNNANIDEVSNTNYMIKEITTLINHLGYYTENHLGQSDFKCHIAVKRQTENKKFDLAILIDDEKHYNNQYLHDSYMLQPEILKEFGWNVMLIFAKDWYENKENVITKIKNKLNEEEENVLINTKPSFLEKKYLNKKENFIFTRLETKENTPRFWEIAINNQDIIIQYGKLHSEGKKLIKSYPSMAAAINERRKLIQQKLKKGYVRV